MTINEKHASQASLEKNKELDNLRQEIQELKVTLKVLLHTKNDYREIIKQNVLFNVERLVIPFIDKLRQTGLNEHQAELLDLISDNLDTIISPEYHNVTNLASKLTPTELKVANLIRIGKSNKEIAAITNRSLNTIQSHRFNLRKKLGLKKRKINLRSYLQSQQNDD